MPELIDKAMVLKYLTPRIKPETPYGEGYNRALEDAAGLVALMPTIEPEVKHGKGCEYCKGRSYTKKPLTVITRTMKRVEVCFNFCPNCGADMRDGGADNG